MSDLVYAIPSDLLPGALAPWCAEQGVDPQSVAVAGMTWTRRADGRIEWRYLEFILDEDGCRIFTPSAQDGYQFGPNSTFAKRVRVVTVSSLPSCVVALDLTPEGVERAQTDAADAAERAAMVTALATPTP